MTTCFFSVAYHADTILKGVPPTRKVVSFGHCSKCLRGNILSYLTATYTNGNLMLKKLSGGRAT
jgi:hypothetical protein